MHVYDPTGCNPQNYEILSFVQHIQTYCSNCALLHMLKLCLRFWSSLYLAGYLHRRWQLLALPCLFDAFGFLGYLFNSSLCPVNIWKEINFLISNPFLFLLCKKKLILTIIIAGVFSFVPLWLSFKTTFFQSDDSWAIEKFESLYD